MSHPPLRACFVWNRVQGPMAAAAVDLAARGASVTVISAEPFEAAGLTVHVLDDDALRASTPLGFEASAIPQMRFALGACHAAAAIDARTPLDLIEYAHEDGAGWAIAAARRTSETFAQARLRVWIGHGTTLVRRFDEQHWLDLGHALRQRLEVCSLEGADAAVSSTRTLASLAGWKGSTTMLRHCVADESRRFGPGSPTSFLSPGPMQHHRRHDVVILAALAAMAIDRVDAAPTRKLFLTIGGPDTMTGPTGESCLARLRRFVPSCAETRIGLGESPSHAPSPGAVVFASTLETDEASFLAAAASPVRLLVSDTPEHRELADRCDDASRIEWFISDDPRSLAALMSRDVSCPAPCAPSRGRFGSEDVLATPTLRITTPDRPEASVVIPFFNLAEFLPETVASVRSQTTRAAELIIVDDGSTQPQAAALLNRLEADGAKVIRTTNRGLGAARNAGLRAARSPWVLVLDADDLIHPTYLERTLLAAARCPQAAAIGTFMRCFRDSPANCTGGWMPLGFDRDLLASANFACTASCLLRRDAVLEAGGYDERLISFEDWDLWCVLAQRGLTAEIVPDFLLHYRQRADSMYHATAKRHEAALRMQLLAKHPSLCVDWSRAARVEVAMRHHVEFGDAAAAKPLRYVLADRLNQTVKGLGVHELLKRGLRSAMRG